MNSTPPRSAERDALLLKVYGEGRWRWVLRRGVLRWALVMFFTFFIASFLIPGMKHMTTPRQLAYNAITCLLAGIWFGLSTWKVNIARPAKKLLSQ